MFAQGTQQAARIARGADRRAEVHHGLREIARALGRRDPRRRRTDRGPAARQRLGNREQPRHHPLDIGVDHHRAPPEGDRGDGGGGVIAHPRQAAQARLGIGKRAQFRDRFGAGDQIARAGIVAEPRPGAHHLALVRRRQRRHARPAFGELREVRRDRRSGGLLEHHLGQPHAVWLGSGGARRRAPWQCARRAVVPRQKGICDVVAGLHGGAMAWLRAT